MENRLAHVRRFTYALCTRPPMGGRARTHALGTTLVALLLASLAATATATPGTPWRTPGSGMQLAIAMEANATLELKSDGTVWASGENPEGQLGDGTTTNRSSPVQVLTAPSTPLTSVVEVAGGWYHALAVRSDGTVWTWGMGTSGQLGNGGSSHSSYAVQVMASAGVPLTGVLDVAGGAYHSYALKADGTVWTWGSNKYGQLGTGSTTGPSTCGTDACSPYPVQARTGASSFVLDARALPSGIGGFSSHALLADGTVFGWGDNGYGQLGIGSQSASAYAVRARTDASTNVSGIAQLAAGAYHVVARQAEGSVLAWGRNAEGQLAIGNNIGPSLCTTFACSLYAVQSLTGAGTPIADTREVGAGAVFSAASRSDGSVLAWGSNAYGQLGTGGTTDSSYAAAVKTGLANDIAGVRSIAAGAYHLASLRADGTNWTNGRNVYGQLGNGNNTGPDTCALAACGLYAAQSLFAAGTGFIGISGGTGHTLAVRADGTAWAWGIGLNGRLGNGGVLNSSFPVQVLTGAGTPLTGVISVAAAEAHSTALTADGNAWSWGGNGNGRLGNGSLLDGLYAAPVKTDALTNLARVNSIASATSHGIALRSDGTAWAWGNNYNGEIADGTTTDRSFATPMLRAAGTALAQVVAVAVGDDHSGALTADGVLWGAGRNGHGQLARPPTGPETCATVTCSRWMIEAHDTPGVALDRIVAIGSSGGLFRHAVRADGRVLGMGYNTTGELGDGTRTSRSQPVQALDTGSAALTGIRSASGGYAFATFLDAAGSLWTVGHNGDGQLADGTTTTRDLADRARASAGVDLTGVASADPGGYYVATIRGGSGWTWGDNLYGQLGDCTVFNRPYQVEVQLSCAANASPNAPSSLAQYRNDGTTSIAGGAWTQDGITNNVVLTFAASDPDASQTLRPWVEIRPGATAFSGTCGVPEEGAVIRGNDVSAPTANTAVTATVNVTGLVSGTTYRWRACVTDQSGVASAWTERGGSPDFGVDLEPAVPTLVSPASGAATANTTPLLTATFSDPDAADTGTISFRICSTTDCSGAGDPVASGASTSGIANGSNGGWTVIPALVAGTWYWSARASDQHGVAGAWSSSWSLRIGSPSLSVSVTASASITPSPLLAGQDGTATSVLSVTTDNATGYSLTATDGSDTGSLVHSNATDTIPDWSGTPAAPTTWSAGTSGYFGVSVLSATQGKDTARWGTGATATDFPNLKWAGLQSTTATELASRSSYSSGTDSVEVAYRANPAASQQGGTYSGSVAFTLVANP